ncbi:MAG: cyclic nucleotide-binding domain-containing protein [Proteobacteria bacterium]|nr:cyclic nucleotide-binding domain-containing protein [Pseudomonadota bacterium]MBU1231289.1 cyclic nucleotide-binding domain-containing protein [Pseudomonadota bacterium]MBU1417789.1 cyclic nucleotide-binding domain-containing protein [Pseudomonadota bacterium]MBU1453665.1 cyclic nucleotide-binding domain-containing protein [Pseudomonadota bacterium]
MTSPEQNLDLNVLSKITGTQEFLTRVPIFSGAPAGVAKMFAYLAKREEYAKGEEIISRGARGDRLFLIVSGKVDIFQTYKERRFHMQLLHAESVNYFGELALLAEFDWFFSARAWTDVVLLTISREAFTKVMERFPDSYKVMVQKIIKLHINRFVDQGSSLLGNISPEAWREDPPEG